jgi:hypothetical protein
MNAGETVEESDHGLARWHALRPMDAVAALYSEGDPGTATAVFAALSHAVFDREPPAPANRLRRLLARLTYRVVKRTTVPPAGPGTGYRNRLLERSGHPYARALLNATSADTAALVEGGDPMNGPYMMLAPDIRQNARLWDRLFFQNVQSMDVQLRFIWETRATCDEARRRAAAGRPVRLRAVAAGTGLSALLAFDRLVREGIAVRAEITDRDPANAEKTRRLIAKLGVRRNWPGGMDGTPDLAVRTEDVFATAGPAEPADVVTAVGIFEYLSGSTCETTESRLGLAAPPERHTASDLAAILAAGTQPGGAVIANSYRPDPATRLLELFGKRFDYRTAENLDAVFAPPGLRPLRTVGSGVIYEVKVYEKSA